MIRTRPRREAAPSTAPAETAAAGERCDMCGTVVPVDASGRCRLGHRVRDAADDPGVVSSFTEPAPAPVDDRTLPPTGHGRPATGEAPYRMTDRLRTPLGAAAPPSPSPAISRAAGGDLPVRAPAGDRTPLQPVVVPTEELDDRLVRQHAEDAAAFAAVVDAHAAAAHRTPPQTAARTAEQTADLPASALPPVEQTAELPAAELPADGGRAVLDVLPPDLPAVPVPAGRPTGPRSTAIDVPAASALDGGEPAWAGMVLDARHGATAGSALDVAPDLATASAPAAAEPVYELEPVEDDPDLLPPRTWPERIAAVVFVGLLLAAAVWLAVDLG